MTEPDNLHQRNMKSEFEPMDIEGPSQGLLSGSSRSNRRFPPPSPSLPPKTTLAAVMMLSLGTTLIIWSIVLFLHKKGDRGFAMLILGLLVFLPGSYASYTLYGAYKRWPNFRFEQVPSYDDVGDY